jgi:copper(I)-binding protein
MIKAFIKLLTLGAVLVSGTVFAGSVDINGQWVREAPPGMQMLAGYMIVENNTNQELVLTGASSPAFGTIELHHTVIENGMARMMQQKSMTIPASSKFVFKPKSYHLMLMQPKRQLMEGDKVRITLEFSNYRNVSATFPIRKAAGGMNHHEHNMHMHNN